MYVWILENTSGRTVFYHSLREVEIDEHMVSGLISALNQFTLNLFYMAIESIEMSGLRWAYIHDNANNLLFVTADSKRVNTDILRARLNVIKQRFIQEFITEKGLVDGNFKGDITVFDPFKDIITNFYSQWTQAEDITVTAEFFDMLGIFQQLFNFLKNIIEGHTFSEKKERIYKRIEDFFKDFSSQHDMEEYSELNKITYSRSSGFNLLSLNPNKCDPLIFKKFIITLMNSAIGILKGEFGHNQCLNLFSDEGVISYIYANFPLLKDLKLDNIIFELFFLK